jgi:hypothetical protein
MAHKYLSGYLSRRQIDRHLGKGCCLDDVELVRYFVFPFLELRDLMILVDHQNQKKNRKAIRCQ